MLIDDAAKVSARLDAGNVDEDAIFAETRLQAFERAAGLALATIASVIDEDARHPPLRHVRPKSREPLHLMSLMAPCGSIQQRFQRNSTPSS
jgi:hypothetical protein